MKTKMIISAIAMLAVLAAAFAMVSAEDSDATAAETQITGYGETTGLKAIYYHDGKLLLDIAAFNAPNVDVKVTYTGGTIGSPQTFTALTTGKVGIELDTGITAISRIEVFAHGTTTGDAEYTLSNIAISETVCPIKFNLNESSLLASATDTILEDVTFVRYAVMPVDKTIAGSAASFTKWQFADGTDVSASLSVEDFLFTYGKDVTLKAVWDTTNVKYKVKFDDNVGSIVTGASAVPETVADVAYASQVISDAKLVMTSTNYNFNGWNTAADGSGTTYPVTAGETPSITVSKLHYLTDQEVTLYAMWTIKTYDVTFANDTNGSYYFTDTDGNAIYTKTVNHGDNITFKLVQETTFYKGNKVMDNGTEITPEDGVYTISAVSAAHAVTFSNAAMVGKISFDTVWNAEIETTGEFKINLVNGSDPGAQVAKVKASSFVSYGSYGLLSVTKSANAKDYTYTILSKTTGDEGDYAAASYIIQVSPTTWRVDFAAIEAPVTLKITAAVSGDATLEKFFIDNISGGTVTISIMDDYAFSDSENKVLLKGTIYKVDDQGVIWYTDAQTGQSQDANKQFAISSVSEVSYEYSGTVTVKTGYSVYAAQATWGATDKTLMVIA